MRRLTTAGLALLLLAFPAGARAQPDLTGSVEVNIGQLLPGVATVPVEFVVTIANEGTESCPSMFYVDFWAEYNCPFTCPPSGGCGASFGQESTDLNSSFGPGESATFDHNINLVPNALPYQYCLYVDSVFDFCPEPNEQNNCVCGEYMVNPTILAADLEIVECAVEPDPENPADALFTAVVKNVGQDQTEMPTHVGFYLDKLEVPDDDCDAYFGAGNEDGLEEVPAGLVPGAEVTVQVAVECPAKEYLPACVVNAYMETPEASTGEENCSFPPLHQCLEFADTPDLVIVEFEPFEQAGQAIFQGSISNVGFEDVLPDTPFRVGIWFNSPSEPQQGQCPDQAAGEGLIINYPNEANPDGLALQEVIQFKLGAPLMDNGYYQTWVKVDCEGDIFELDEKNNTATFGLFLEAPGPDLSVTDCAAELTEDNEGFTVHYSAWVKNKGTDSVPGCDIDFFFHSDLQPTVDNMGTMGGGYVPFDQPIEPGQPVLIEHTWSKNGGVPQGNYLSWCCADFLNLIWETSTDNNCLSVDVVVPEFIPGFPNLVIETFTLKVIGNDIHYSIVIGNTGDKDAKIPFRIDLFTDQEGQPVTGDYGDFTQTVDYLAVGDSVEWSPTWENAPDGEYKAYIILDTENSDEETVEADNVAGPRIAVVCSTCKTCIDGEYAMEGGCFCGEETIVYGFCCAGEWYAVGCPADGVDDYGEDVYSTESPTAVVEWHNDFFLSQPNCGCRLSTMPRLPGGSVLLLILAMALLGVLKRTRRSRV